MQYALPTDPGPGCPELLRVVVEIPKHSANKYEYDETLGVFRLSRALYSPLHYPGDYGFIPGTLAEDGYPLDTLVLVTDPSFPGCLVEVRPVGLLNLVDAGLVDQKVLAVPHRNPRFHQTRSLADIFPHTKSEIEHFFTIYKELEGYRLKVEGWFGPEGAKEVIVKARDRYLEREKAAAVPSA